MRRRLIVSALLLPLLAPAANAELLVEQRGRSLPRATVTALAQDEPGFLWIGTPHGLFRHDGYEFLELGSQAGLPGSRITTLARDPDGALVVGTRRGLAILASGAERFESASGELATAHVTALASLPDALIVGTASSGLVLVERRARVSRWRHVLLAPGTIPAGAITAVAGDERSVYAATASGGIVMIDRRTSEVDLLSVSRAHGQRVTALATGLRGELWVGTDSGSVLRREPAARALVVVSPGATGAVTDLAIDRDGALWIARERMPVERLAAGGSEFASAARGALALFVDDGGLVWMGLHGGVLAVHNPASRRFERLVDPRSVHDATDDPGVIWGVARSGGSLWAASDRGVLRIGGSGSPEPLDEPAGPAYAIVAANDRLWVALGPRGFARVDVGTGVRMFEAGSPVYALHVAGNRVLAGGANTVVVIDPDGAQRVVRLPGSGDLVRSFASAAEGRVAVGTESGAIHVIDPELAIVVAGGRVDVESGAGTPLLQLATVADGELFWAAAREAGALLVDPSGSVVRRLAPGHDFETDLVYGVASDGLGFVWLTTNTGLFRLDERRGETVRFTTSDGLADGRLAAGSLTVVDGLVFAGGHAALTAFDPSIVAPSLARPPIVVTAIRPLGAASDQSVFEHRSTRRLATPYTASVAGEPIVLPGDSRGFEIEAAALDFSDPDAIRYAHRLVGRDAAWVETGADRRFVVAGLRPGDYRLLIRATNADGVITTAPIDLTIRIPEPVWQQPAVALAAVAGSLLVVVLLLLHRSRVTAGQRRALDDEIARRTTDARLSTAALEREVEVRRRAEQTLRHLQEQLEHRVAVRTNALREANERLAAEVAERTRAQAAAERALDQNRALLEEVHHRVKNNMQVVSSLLSLQSAQIDHRGARAAFDVSRQRIDAMAMIHQRLYQSGDFSAVSMSDYLDALVRSLQRLHGTRVRVETHVRARPVDLSLATSCGLLANELITNAMKHAFPGDAPGEARISIEFVDDGSGYRFSIADNGVGLGARRADPAERIDPGGLGMKLVEVLAAQLDAGLTVRSGHETPIGRGTEVTIEIPVGRDPDAYQTRRLPP